MFPIDPIPLALSLIQHPSITPKDEGVIATLRAALERIGFTCWELPFQEPGSDYTLNLFARFGAGAPHFCFAGHTDVVPAGDAVAWRIPPFQPRVENGVLYGRGAEDMKGAIACFITAAEHFISSHGTNFKGSISLLIAADEEGIAINGTRKVLEWMQEHAHIPDVCVVGEPTNPDFIGEMAKIGRRGSMNCALIIHGKQGHAAYPHLADNPLTKMVDVLHTLTHHHFDSGTEYFPPTNLQIVSVDVGNPASNVIPEKAEARFNIRFNDLHNSAKLTQWLHATCKQYAVEKYTLNVRVTGESFLTKPSGLSDLVVRAVEKVTGHAPQLSTTGGTSDARFIHEVCPVIEFGTTGKTPHMVNECVAVHDLHLLAACYHQMLSDYFS